MKSKQCIEASRAHSIYIDPHKLTLEIKTMKLWAGTNTTKMKNERISHIM